MSPSLNEGNNYNYLANSLDSSNVISWKVKVININHIIGLGIINGRKIKG